MATRKKQAQVISLDSNFDKMKEEILTLLTGQDIDQRQDFNYVTLLRRTMLLLIAVYGISRVQVLRQLAVSIVTTFITRWLAQQAAQAMTAA